MKQVIYIVLSLITGLSAYAETFSATEIADQIKTYDCELQGLPNTLWRKFTAFPNRRIRVPAKSARDAMIKVTNAEMPMMVSERGMPIVTIQGETWEIKQIICE